MNEKNKPLFRSNFSLTDGTTPVSNGFEAGNSFTVVYDDIETINVAAELNIDLTKELSVGGTVAFNNYATTNELEAWNLPSITSTIFADYQAKEWYLGSELYFVGERKELSQPFIGIPTVKTLKSYVDLNFNGGYVFSDRLTAFAKLNNVLSPNYDSYNHFEVQGFQMLTGIIYKFNM
jgi:outer membrane receptor protein involved in Fe transport